VSKALSRLERSQPTLFLEEFIRRSVECALWYADQAFERELKSAWRPLCAAPPAERWFTVGRGF
jgi:hypothetical protein